MKLIINGKSEEIFLTENTISELLQIKKVEMPEMVSVELNGKILSRQEFNSTLIKNDDIIEFLYFMGGGQLIRSPKND